MLKRRLHNALDKKMEISFYALRCPQVHNDNDFGLY